MQAGTAVVDFTPEPGLVSQGHLGAPPTHTVLHPLEARAIVFADDADRAAICTLDVIGVTGDFTQRVRRRVGDTRAVPADRILIACSHTHCAPAAIAAVGLQPDAAFLAGLEDAAVDAIVTAASRLEPVTLGLGAGAANFNINRRSPAPVGEDAKDHFVMNHGGVVDRRVRLLRVDGASGAPLAVLFHYSCHPTTMTGMQGNLSSDYPGAARERIEERLQCHALFMPGCFGNIRPAIVNPETGGFRDATREQVDACGAELGDAVVTAMRYVRTVEHGGLASRSVDVTFPFDDLPSPDELRATAADSSSRESRARAAWARKVLERLEGGAALEGDVATMQTLRIGPLRLLAIPGEVVQEIGFDVEKALTSRCGADALWAMGYCNDMVGYLVTERQKQECGYEPGAYWLFNRPARFREEQSVIVDAATRLLGGGRQSH